MPNKPFPLVGNEHRLRDAMRKAPRVTAVIRSDGYGIFVELSDGRHCCLRHEMSPVKPVGIAAAVGWAKRRGATEVTILD
jgi:hypothetical protein